MFIPILCFVVGAAAMGRTKPQTRVRKLLCLGPKSGIVYSAEDFPEVGTIIVRAPSKAAVAQFQRRSMTEPGAIGLVFQSGQGDPRLIAVMRKDFEHDRVEPPKGLDWQVKAGCNCAFINDPYKAPELHAESCPVRQAAQRAAASNVP